MGFCMFGRDLLTRPLWGDPSRFLYFWLGSSTTARTATATGRSTQEPNIRKAVPNVEVVTFETTQQAFLALQQGKGAGYVNDEASCLNCCRALERPGASC